MFLGSFLNSLNASDFNEINEFFRADMFGSETLWIFYYLTIDSGTQNGIL